MINKLMNLDQLIDYSSLKLNRLVILSISKNKLTVSIVLRVDFNMKLISQVRFIH